MNEDGEVSCPISGCNYAFNPVAAAKHAGFSCSGCGSGWRDFHEAVEFHEPADDVQNEGVEITYPFDGQGGAVQ